MKLLLHSLQITANFTSTNVLNQTTVVPLVETELQATRTPNSVVKHLN